MNIFKRMLLLSIITVFSFKPTPAYSQYLPYLSTTDDKDFSVYELSLVENGWNRLDKDCKPLDLYNLDTIFCNYRFYNSKGRTLRIESHLTNSGHESLSSWILSRPASAPPSKNIFVPDYYDTSGNIAIKGNSGFISFDPEIMTFCSKKNIQELKLSTEEIKYIKELMGINPNFNRHNLYFTYNCQDAE